MKSPQQIKDQIRILLGLLPNTEDKKDFVEELFDDVCEITGAFENADSIPIYRDGKTHPPIAELIRFWSKETDRAKGNQ